MAIQSAPLIHSVYFYDTEEAFMQRLIGVATSALNSGNGVLVIITPEHAEQLAQFLSPRLIRNAHAMARLTIVDAAAVLEKCMANGVPDRDCFLQAIHGLVKEASIPADGAGGNLTVFAEMVAVHWARGQKEAALELERLWNEALAGGSFYLHCAYPKSHFAYAPDQSAITAICEHHSHTFGALDAAM